MTAQGHTAKAWQSWATNPGLADPKARTPPPAWDKAKCCWRQRSKVDTNGPEVRDLRKRPLPSLQALPRVAEWLSVRTTELCPLLSPGSSLST